MHTGKVLKEYGIVLKKSLGQNFLKNLTIPTKIIEKSGVDAKTNVVEIGVGAGTMTQILVEKANSVIGFEIDERFRKLHKEQLNIKNLIIRYEDFLKADLSSLPTENLMYIANIPYNITSPILEKVLFDGPEFDSAILMVQKEYADRLLAKPSTKEYGGLTVSVRTFAIVERLFDVNRSEFIPEPAVDSTVIRVRMREDSPISADLKNSYRSLVKLSFSQRRKKLKNNLKSMCKDTESILASLNISPNARAEELSVEDFVALYFQIRSVAHENGDASRNT